MFQKLFTFILVTASMCAAAFGQTPDTKKDNENSPRTFAFSLDGDGGYLGVQTQEVSKENFAKFGLREVRGVAIEKVIENSPAAAAGLQAGDVIVRLDGEEITSGRKLTRLIGEISPDHRVKIAILRNGAEQEITATLGKRQGPVFGNGNFEFSTPMPMGKMEMPALKDLPQFKDLPQLKDIPELKDMPQDGTPRLFTFPGGEGKALVWKSEGGRQIGVGVTPLTKQLAEHFGVEDGVMINEVRDGSAAAKAGLKAGDIIVEADGKSVKGEFDLVRSINGKKEGDVTLQIVRGGKRQSVAVTPEASKDGGFLFQNEGENGDALMRATPRVRIARPAVLTPVPLPMALMGRGRIL